MPKKIIYQIDPKRRNADGSFPDLVFSNNYQKRNLKIWLFQMYHNKANHAKDKNIPFSLRFCSFLNFCRKTNYHKLRGRGSHEMTIDRINNLMGYDENNIQMLSKRDNVRKYFEHDKKLGKREKLVGMDMSDK